MIWVISKQFSKRKWMSHPSLLFCLQTLISKWWLLVSRHVPVVKVVFYVSMGIRLRVGTCTRLLYSGYKWVRNLASRHVPVVEVRFYVCARSPMCTSVLFKRSKPKETWTNYRLVLLNFYWLRQWWSDLLGCKLGAKFRKWHQNQPLE